MRDLTEALVELVRRTSTDLPEDIEQALVAAREREVPGSAARGAMDTILQNVAMARRDSTPICQDTGTPIFFVRHPVIEVEDFPAVVTMDAHGASLHADIEARSKRALESLLSA